jgi:hypothetical protein
MNILARLRILAFSILFLAGAISPILAADWEGVFEGTLGKSRIIVQLVEPLDDMEGETGREASRYSYLPKARDINLMLSKNAMPLAFEETLLLPWELGEAKGDDRMITGKWSLTVAGDAATGTWASLDGKKSLPITLARVPMMDEAEKHPDDNIVNATYTARWIKEVTFADAGVAKSSGSVEVRFVKDSAFGIAYPVIGAFPDEVQKSKINDLLLAHHTRSVAQYRDCKNGVPVTWEEASGEPEFSYSIGFASPTLLSITESGSVFCGGAHPANYIKPITYDLTQPARMGGDELLDLSPQGFGRVLKLATKDERIAFERFALGLWKQGAARDTEMAGECNTGWIDDSPEGEKNFSLSFSETGLAVQRSDFPHALSVCQFTNFNPTLIPWADLKPWLKPGQALLQVP